MPELPEVETLASQLQSRIGGKIIEDVCLLHPEFYPIPPQILRQKVIGAKIESVARKGKYIRLKIQNDASIWFHLGMTGQLLWLSNDGALDPHVHVWMRFAEPGFRLIFRDPRRFGKFFVTDSATPLPLGLRELGPEPLEIGPSAFIACFQNRTGKLKSLLMNQKLIAGLGNIYADEILHAAKIDPRRRAGKIKSDKLLALYQSMRQILEKAIALGGSSIDDYLHFDGARGSYQKFHQVYGRGGQICYTCGARIRRVVLAGRSTHFCPMCQRG